MSIRRESMSKSQRASITSSPLFMSVAESMVILSPIDQFGCLSARAGVTSRSSGPGTVRRGPPLAVRMRRRTSSRLWPASDWWIALCSESTGRIVTPRSAARRTSSSPARTSDSLFASPTVFPASMAAAVERSPAPPEIAARTKSTSGWEAAVTAPASPASTSTPAGTRARSARAVASSCTETRRGRKRRTCSASRVAFLPAASDTTSNRSGKRGTPGCALAKEPAHVLRADVDPRGDEEERVDAVEEAPVPGDDPGGVLHPGRPLHHRLREVAERSEHRRAEADDDGGLRRELPPEQEPARDEGAGDAADRSAGEPLPGLLGRDPLVELVPPEGVSGEVREGVVRPGDHEGEDHPGDAEAEAQADERRDEEPAVEPRERDDRDRAGDLLERPLPEQEHAEQEDGGARED